MPRLTMDDVDKKIDEILTQAEPARPVERAGVVSSLLERIRGRRGIKSTEGILPPPTTPKLLKMPEYRR